MVEIKEDLMENKTTTSFGSIENLDLYFSDWVETESEDGNLAYDLAVNVGGIKGEDREYYSVGTFYYRVIVKNI